MLRKVVIGPTHEQLRPLKHQADKAKLQQAENEHPNDRRRQVEFPVHPRLIEDLRQARGMVPDPVARHVCAVLSAWSYSDHVTVAEMMARLGLFRNRCLLAEIANNGMLVRSTAFLVQSACRSVTLLVYRGTDPFDLSTWAVSSDVNPVMVPVRDNKNESSNGGSIMQKGRGADRHVGARVHGGFYRNQRATWFGLTAALKRAAVGESIMTRDEIREHEGELTGDEERDATAEWAKRRAANERPLLFITGHSLGGAMATIAAYKLATDPQYDEIAKSLAQIYTFAQPMVGNAGFKAAWEDTFIAKRLFCHTHQRDVIPHLPPADTKKFAHVGTHYASEERTDVDPSTPEWQWTDRPVPPPEQVGSWTAIPAAFAGFLGKQIPGFGKLLDGVQRTLVGVSTAVAVVDDALTRVPLLRRGPQTRILSSPAVSGGWLSIYDHLPAFYVACSQPDGVLTEFGDDF
jgi:hypothetical protein